MLKEYTLKVTVQVGGEVGPTCDDRVEAIIQQLNYNWGATCEITDEEVVQEEPEHD